LTPRKKQGRCHKAQPHKNPYYPPFHLPSSLIVGSSTYLFHPVHETTFMRLTGQKAKSGPPLVTFKKRELIHKKTESCSEKYKTLNLEAKMVEGVLYQELPETLT
jgi:hypothetical protein